MLYRSTGAYSCRYDFCIHASPCSLQSEWARPTARIEETETRQTQIPGPPPKIRLPENLPQQKGKGGKESEDTIRINSDLVNVVVTIAGRPSNASLDLKPEDFEILEDGAPQEIANFSRDADQPLKLVMLFDTSLSVAQVLNFERRAAARFFERVIRPQDRAAVFSVSTDVVVLQEFTNKVPLLVDATRQLRAQGATSLYDASTWRRIISRPPKAAA